MSGQQNGGYYAIHEQGQANYYDTHEQGHVTDLCDHYGICYGISKNKEAFL